MQFPIFSLKVCSHALLLTYGVHPDPDLYLSNRRISCVETTHYLVDFDSLHTWVAYLHFVKTACQKNLSLVRILANFSWLPNRNTLLLLLSSPLLTAPSSLLRYLKARIRGVIYYNSNARFWAC